MNKTHLNFLIDAFSFIAFLFLVTTGVLMRYILPPGSGHYLTILGLDRHEWAGVHFWVAIVFFGLIALHLFLHWRWIAAVVTGKNRKGSGVRAGPGIAGLAAVLVMALAPLFPAVQYDPERVTTTALSARTNDKVIIQGSMTLAELEEKTAVPSSYVLEALSLPASTSIHQRLGPLVRAYGLAMDDVRNVVDEYENGRNPVNIEKLKIKVISFNVRFDNPDDGINQWKYRIPVIMEYMASERPDIIGMQENLHHQNEDLLEIMPGYTYVGTGRDDGKKGGEFTPVFYRQDGFEALEDSQFWLSETPYEPGSIGWEAVLPRIVTWIKLKHIDTGKEIYVFNTHFSHVSDKARRQSMIFMSEKIAEIAGDRKIIVTGDFNIRKGSALYEEMRDRFLHQNRLTNADYLAREKETGTGTTFNGFRAGIEPRVIDYIFVSPHFSVERYAVDEVMDGDVYISDHWPVQSVLTTE